jgi:hypothetical protein
MGLETKCDCADEHSSNLLDWGHNKELVNWFLVEIRSHTSQNASLTFYRYDYSFSDHWYLLNLLFFLLFSLTFSRS